MSHHTETVILPIELTNRNDGQGRAFWKSHKDRKELERMLRLMGMARRPFPFPVAVTVTRILGKGQRLWDPSSILRGNYKQIEDSLTALGWWVDDSPKYITMVDGRQDPCRRNQGPAIELTIEQDGEPFKGDTKTGTLE